MAFLASVVDPTVAAEAVKGAISEYSRIKGRPNNTNNTTTNNNKRMKISSSTTTTTTTTTTTIENNGYDKENNNNNSDFEMSYSSSTTRSKLSQMEVNTDEDDDRYVCMYVVEKIIKTNRKNYNNKSKKKIFGEKKNVQKEKHETLLGLSMHVPNYVMYRNTVPCINVYMY